MQLARPVLAGSKECILLRPLSLSLFLSLSLSLSLNVMLLYGVDRRSQGQKGTEERAQLSARSNRKAIIVSTQKE
jgi:hypothetical protein